MRSLIIWAQFLHAWLVSRVAMRTSRHHIIDAASALVVAPHPDDETLGCGGLIAAKRASGAKVTVVFLSDGSRGTPRPGQVASQSLVRLRRAEGDAALGHLGVDRSQIHFWNYPDGELNALDPATRDALVERLTALIQAEGIHSIYVPHGHDGHPDHQMAFALAKAACAQTADTVRLYQYAIWMWWSQPILIRLQWQDLSRRTLHRVGAAIGQKRRALLCHASQLPRFPRGFLAALPFENEIFFESVIGSTPSPEMPRG